MQSQHRRGGQGGADDPGLSEIALRIAKLVAMALAKHDLTDNQFRVLTFVSNGAPSLREMSARLVMKPPNLSQLIQGLVRRGLVQRGRAHGDRRRFELRVTPKGSRLLSAATEKADAAVVGLARLGDGSARQRVGALRTWRSAVVEAARLVHEVAGER